jgi:hypothetical protein
MVHDDVASSTRTGYPRWALAVAPPHGGGPVPCVARPGSPLVHPDGRCECFFGGPPPEFGVDTGPTGILP